MWFTGCERTFLNFHCHALSRLSSESEWTTGDCARTTRKYGQHPHHLCLGSLPHINVSYTVPGLPVPGLGR